jgi:hypothetical protein
MKKQLLLIICLLISNHIVAQMSREDIVGKWRVVKVLMKNDNPNLTDLITSFESAQFEFEENSNFNISTSKKSELFSMVENMAKNTKWKLEEQSLIKVRNKSNGSILEILVSKQDGKTIFEMRETELELEVVKL